MNANTETTAANIMELTNGAQVTIGGKKFTIELSEADPSYIALIGVRGAENFLRGYTNLEGIFQVISWKSGAPVVNKAQQPLKVAVLGNLIEDITGKKIKF